MSGFASSLDALPVLGILFQFIGYVVANSSFMSQTTVAVAVPIAFAALCGVLCERSGVVNIGLEGIMLTTAFVGWVIGAAAVGLLAAILAGMAVSLLHAWLAITLRVDQIISGTIINIGAVGITGYMYTLLAPQSPVGAGEFSAFVVPTQIADLPLVGWLLNAV